MIERIDIPDKAIFTNDSDGVQPYYSKYSIPISLIKYTDTVRTVKNSGMNAYWFRNLIDASANVNTAYSALVPVCKFYYDDGYPPFFTQDETSIDWAVRYEGKFYAPYAGYYEFAFAGDGRIKQFYFKSTDTAISFKNTFDHRDNKEANLIFTDNNYWTTDYKQASQYKDTSWNLLTAETWHSVSFIYHSDKKEHLRHGLIGLWKCYLELNTTNQTAHNNTPEYIPISAGVCCPIAVSTSGASNGQTIVSHTVNSYISTDLTSDMESISTFRFNVPLIETSKGYDYNGYFHSSDSFVHVTDALELEKHRMIEYYEGYRIVKNDNFAIDCTELDYIEITHGGELDCTSALTIECWIKTSNDGVIVCKSHSDIYTSPYYSYVLWLDSDGEINLNIGTTTDKTSGAGCKDGQWHYVVVTTDGTYWKYYIDGILNQDASHSQLPDGDNSRPVHMGKDVVQDASSLDGIIDEIRIYSRVITLAEVQHNYNNGIGNRSPYNKEEMQGEWRIIEGSGVTVNDSSENGNDGTFHTVTGTTWVTGAISHRDEYVKKFTGHIKDFNVKYGTGDEIEVYCEGFDSFLRESFNLYNPTPIDYAQVEYFLPQDEGDNKRVEGKNKPQAFDGWEINRVIQILMTESYIDPYLFYGKKSFSDNNEQQVDGEYLIKYTGDIVNSLKLDVKTNYGYPNIVSAADSKPDDAYINSINLGDYYFDAISEIIKPYYMDFHFDRNGYPNLRSYNTPYMHIDETNFDITGWTAVTNIHHLKGAYVHTVVANITASADFTGKCVDLLFGVGPSCGVTAGTSVRAYLIYNGSTIITQDIDLYNATSWGYLDGIYPPKGYNPCIVRLGKGLDYDNYTVQIKANPVGNPGYDVRFDGVLVYDEDYENFTNIIDSGDDYNQGGITTLNTKTTGKDLRNEVYVYGSLRGPVTGVGEDGAPSVVNPNNPIYKYNYSISRDINSIYNSTAFNYTGRPMRVLIQDPRINNERQADLVSYNVLETYRQNYISPTFDILPNPLIEPSDCVALVDLYKNYLSSNNPIWIGRINSRLSMANKISYGMNVDANPIKPPDGYWEIPEYATSVVNGVYTQNIKLTNTGVIMLPDGNVSDSDTTIVLDTSFYNHRLPTYSVATSYNILNRIPDKGYARLGNEIIYYEHTAGSQTLTSLKRGLQGTHSAAHIGTDVNHHLPSNGVFISLAYDPYTGETMGVFPKISFDCMANGKIQIKIFGVGYQEDYHVATLTGLEDENYPFGGYDQVKIGKYGKIWDATDQMGIYNELVTNGEITGSYFYVGENARLHNNSDDPPYGKPNPSAFPYSSEGWNSLPDFGDFYFTIDFITDDGDKYHTSSRFNGGPPHVSADKDFHIYTRRGPRGMFLFHIDTSVAFNMYSKRKDIEITTHTIPLGYSSAPPYPPDTLGYNSEKNEVYIRNGYNSGDGLITSLYDCSWDLDSSDAFPYQITQKYTQHDFYAARHYKADIKFNIVTYVYNRWIRDQYFHDDEWKVYHIDGDYIKDDSFVQYYRGGAGYTRNFKPKGAITSENEIVQWIPPDCLKRWREIRAQKTMDYSLIQNYIFFSGEVYDKSGRAVWQRWEIENLQDYEWAGNTSAPYVCGLGGLFNHLGIIPDELENNGNNFYLRDGKTYRQGDPKQDNFYIDDAIRTASDSDINDAPDILENGTDYEKILYAQFRNETRPGVNFHLGKERGVLQNYITWMDEDYCTTEPSSYYERWYHPNMSYREIITNWEGKVSLMKQTLGLEWDLVYYGITLYDNFFLFNGPNSFWSFPNSKISEFLGEA